jgi:hypothetical protein
MDRSDSDADGVETPSGNYKADAVEHCILAGRQFSSVRMSVKNREEADEQSSIHEGRANFEHHSGTEQNGGRGNPVFDSWNRDSHEAQQSAYCHYNRKGDG